jgi:hypothetical protein
MNTSSVEFDPRAPVASFASTWRRIVLDPVGFFGALPPAGGLEPPLAFATICLAIGGVESAIFYYGVGLKGMIGLIVLGLVRLFIGSAIVAFIAQRIFDGHGDYEATFRALAYTSAFAVAIGIPLVKYFAAIYGAYMTIVAIARAHGYDNTRAFLTLLATAFVGFVVVHALGLWHVARAVNPLFR